MPPLLFGLIVRILPVIWRSRIVSLFLSELFWIAREWFLAKGKAEADCHLVGVTLGK